MWPPADDASIEARRIVICDYNALLLSVTGLLRISGYRVFQAHDGLAARELCYELPRIGLLILNSTGAGVDTPSLIGLIRTRAPGPCRAPHRSIASARDALGCANAP